MPSLAPPAAPARLRSWLLRSLVIVLALVTTIIGFTVATAVHTRGAAAHLARVEMDALAFQAGLLETTPPGRLSVQVVVEGGSKAIASACNEAVSAHRHFEADPSSQHVVRFEQWSGRHVLASRGKLWRQGWDVMSPRASDITIAPWIAWLTGFCAIFAIAWRVPPSIAWTLAGAFGQTGLRFLRADDYQQFGAPAGRELGFDHLEYWLIHAPADDHVFAVAGGSLAVMTAIVGWRTARRGPRARAGVIIHAVIASAGVAAWVHVAANTSAFVALDRWEGIVPMAALGLAACFALAAASRDGVVES